MAEGGEDMDLVEDVIITPFSRPTPTLQSPSGGKRLARHFKAPTPSDRRPEQLCSPDCLVPVSDRLGVWSHALQRELSNRGGGETPTSIGALNLLGTRSGSTAQRTRGSGAARRTGDEPEGRVEETRCVTCSNRKSSSSR